MMFVTELLLMMLHLLLMVVDQVQVVRVEGLDGRGLHIHQGVLRGGDDAGKILVDLHRSLREGDRKRILSVVAQL